MFIIMGITFGLGSGATAVIAQFIGLQIISSYFTQELPFGIEKPQLQEDISYIPL